MTKCNKLLKLFMDTVILIENIKHLTQLTIEAQLNHFTRAQKVYLQVMEKNDLLEKEISNCYENITVNYSNNFSIYFVEKGTCRSMIANIVDKGK